MHQTTFKAVVPHTFKDQSVSKFTVEMLVTDEVEADDTLTKTVSFTDDHCQNRMTVHSKEQWEAVKRAVDMAFEFDFDEE